MPPRDSLSLGCRIGGSPSHARPNSVRHECKSKEIGKIPAWTIWHVPGSGMPLQPREGRAVRDVTTVTRGWDQPLPRSHRQGVSGIDPPPQTFRTPCDHPCPKQSASQRGRRDQIRDFSREHRQSGQQCVDHDRDTSLSITPPSTLADAASHSPNGRQLAAPFHFSRSMKTTCCAGLTVAVQFPT